MAKQAILCVDDEAMILFVLKQQLKNYFGDKFIYETAENADEAFEIIEELKSKNIEIVLIVSDWLMPGMKGDDFLISIHQKYPKIVKIMITGQAENQSIQKAKQEANLHACIMKPWNLEELLTIIEKSLIN